MEKEILDKLAEQDKKLADIYSSCEKTRKYFLASMIVTIIMIILPLLGLIIVIPLFLNSLNIESLGL